MDQPPTEEEMIEALHEADFDVAQICLNGHLINETATTHGEKNQQFCENCGAATLHKCDRCGWPIRGGRTGTAAPYSPIYSVPAFCMSCGEPYPWTQARIEAAKELAEELDGLTDDEKALFKRSINDIVRDSPRTTVAATRFKKLLIKGRKELADGFRDILVDVASETAKKILWS